MAELLSALSELEDTKLIFTLPNADPGGNAMIKMIEDFCSRNSNTYTFASLGQLRYLSLIAIVDGVVGNSSSGILEAPSLKKGTVNIGDRQLGRLQAKSVVNCLPRKESILAAIKTLYSKDFQLILPNVTSPYGEGGASTKVVQVLRETSLEGIIKKTFHDLQ